MIILLGQKDRHADALALLEGDIGKKTKAIENVELRHMRIELLIRIGRWQDAREATKDILQNDKYELFVGTLSILKAMLYLKE